MNPNPSYDAVAAAADIANTLSTLYPSAEDAQAMLTYSGIFNNLRFITAPHLGSYETEGGWLTYSGEQVTGLSAGATIGIVVGACVVVIGALIFLVIKFKGGAVKAAAATPAVAVDMKSAAAEAI